MLKRNRIWACVLVPLYIATWVGGWISHAQQLQERAEKGYCTAQRENEEMEVESRREGLPFHPIELRKDGPITRVYWCLPVLPGVLLADSDYCVGPMCAGGGLKVILYYGFGTTEIWTPWYWMT